MILWSVGLIGVFFLSGIATASVVTIDGYEYTVACHSGDVQWPDQGSGWTMAAIRSASGNNALASMNSGNIWFGAKNVNEGTGQYMYMHGRWQGVTLSTGYGSPSCQQFCFWSGGQPDHSTCPTESPQTYPLIIGSQWDGARHWDDVWLMSCNNRRSAAACVACERSPCVQSDCSDPANMINPSGYWPSCSCSYRACRQSDCSDPTNMINPSGTYPSCSCSRRACTLADCPRPGMVRVHGHYTACHCDTVSQSLSLSTLVTASIEITNSEDATATLSLAHTSSVTTSATFSLSTTLSHVTPSHTHTLIHSLLDKQNAVYISHGLHNHIVDHVAVQIIDHLGHSH